MGGHPMILLPALIIILSGIERPSRIMHPLPKNDLLPIETSPLIITPVLMCEKFPILELCSTRHLEFNMQKLPTFAPEFITEK